MGAICDGSSADTREGLSEGDSSSVGSPLVRDRQRRRGSAAAMASAEIVTQSAPGTSRSYVRSPRSFRAIRAAA